MLEENFLGQQTTGYLTYFNLRQCVLSYFNLTLFNLTLNYFFFLVSLVSNSSVPEGAA